MGQFTPNIGLYIPAAGDTNYTDSFAAGMINLDLHDHSGGPNKGVQITSSGLGNYSVTYNKLAANVADPTTGIGVNSNPAFQNQLQILGILRNLFTLASVPGVGFTSMNGSTIAARTFQDSASLTWTNPDGVAGNPSAVVNIAGISPVTVSNGGTGRTSLTANGVVLGGNSTTNPVQQVAGDGVAQQYLGSNGPGVIPSWQTLPVIPSQTLFQATVTMTAAQFKTLSGTPVQIVPAQGAGKVIVPVSALGKLNYTTAAFGSGSSVRFYYGSAGSIESTIRFDTGTFDDSLTAYYQAVGQTVTTSGIASASMENVGLFISVNSSNFSNGGTNTVTITVFYNVVQI